jgi:hypothetical protein
LHRDTDEPDSDGHIYPDGDPDANGHADAHAKQDAAADGHIRAPDRDASSDTARPHYSDRDDAADGNASDEVSQSEPDQDHDEDRLPYCLTDQGSNVIADGDVVRHSDAQPDEDPDTDSDANSDADQGPAAADPHADVHSDTEAAA